MEKGIDWSKDNIYDALGRPELKPRGTDAKTGYDLLMSEAEHAIATCNDIIKTNEQILVNLKSEKVRLLQEAAINGRIICSLCYSDETDAPEGLKPTRFSNGTYVCFRCMEAN